MKRLTTHLAISVVTFLVGVAIEWAFIANHHTTQVSRLEVVKPVPSSRSELSVTSIPTLPASGVAYDYDPKEFDPRGDYQIMGRKPKGFSEFDCLELAVDDFDGRVSGEVMVQTYSKQTPNAYRTYNANYVVSGRVTKERLTFVAPPVFEEDFEYRFDGRFLRAGVLSDAGKNTAVLKGKLSKFKGGVKIAEAEVRFRMEYLGC